MGNEVPKTDILSEKDRLEQSLKLVHSGEAQSEASAVPLKVVTDQEPPRVNTAKSNYQEFFKTMKETDTGFDPKAARIAELKKNMGYAENEEVEQTPSERFDDVRKVLDARLYKKENQNAELAKLIADKKHEEIYSDPDKLQHFKDNESDIHYEADRIKEGRAVNIENTRRRASSNQPFPVPKSVRVETAPVEAKTEIPKPVEKPKPAPIVMPERVSPKTIQDVLKQRELAQSKEDKNQKMAEALARGESVDEEYHKANQTDIDRRFLKIIGAPGKTNQHEDELEGFKEDSDHELLPKNEVIKNPEAILKPTAVKESIGNKFKLDGNVQFSMEKLGIIGTGNPKEFEARKAEAIANIQREIPNFFKLSPSQQSYVLDKLRQKASHDLDQSTSAELKQAKGIKRLFSGFREGGVRSRLAKEIKGGGLESYKENLRDITNFVENRGLDVEMTEKGMVLKFLSHEPKNDSHREMIKEFNSRATALAEIPYDKTIGDRTPLQILQKKKYEKARKTFDEARERLLSYEGAKSPEDEVKKLLEFSNIEDDVRLNQALTYNQEATSWIGQKIQKFGLAEKGAIAASGFATRGLAKYAAGFGGGVVASALLGGAMGRLRKSQEFQNIAKDKRYGEAATSTEKRAGVKEFIDSKGYGDKIQKLIERIDKAPEGKRQELIQQLQNRVMVARERDQAGLVRFGNAKEELKNKFAFIQSMKEAQSILVQNNPEFMKASEIVAERLNNIYFKDGEKDAARKEEMKKAFWRGVRNGSILFVAGFEARDWLMHDGEATKAGLDWAKKTGESIYGDIAEGYRNIAGDVSGGFKDFKADVSEGVRTVGEIGKDIRIGVSESREAVQEGLKNFSGGASIENITDAPEVPAKPEATSVRINPISEITPDVPEFRQTFSMVGGRGAIGAIEDLQRKMIDQYGGNMPENLKAFVEAKPEKLAQEWGFYRPGEVNESATILKGAKFGVANNGQITFEDNTGRAVRLDGGAGKFDGKFYDGARGAILGKQPEPVFEHYKFPDSPAAKEPVLPHYESEVPDTSTKYGGDIISREIVTPATGHSAPWWETENSSANDTPDSTGSVPSANAEESMGKIIKGRFILPEKSKLIELAVKKHGGGILRTEGNVIFFKDGQVGFYAESLDERTAGKLSEETFKKNAEILRIDSATTPERIATKMPNNGPIRYLSIYKKAA